MAQGKEMSGSQVAGAVIGRLVGGTKGMLLGASATIAVSPILGPFAPLAIVLLPLGAAAGGYYGEKIGSQGLGRAALMVAGMVGGDLIPGAGNAGTDDGLPTSGPDCDPTAD
jgi:hypothetical protein